MPSFAAYHTKTAPQRKGARAGRIGEGVMENHSLGGYLTMSIMPLKRFIRRPLASE